MTDPEITLDKTQIAEAMDVAQMRQDNAVLEGRMPGQGLRADYLNDLKINQRGALGELAAKIYLDPVKWNAFKTGRLDNTPDLEDYIDVKWIGVSHHRLPILPNGKPHWIYFLVDGSRHPTYRMARWCWGWEGMIGKYWGRLRENRDKQWNIPQDAVFMRKADELLYLVRQRQAA